MAKKYTLMSAVTTDTNGSDVEINSRSADLILEVYGTGTFTVKIQVKASDGSTYIDVRDLDRNVINVTSNERLPVFLEYGATVRAVTSGTSGASVNVNLIKAGENR